MGFRVKGSGLEARIGGKGSRIRRLGFSAYAFLRGSRICALGGLGLHSVPRCQNNHVIVSI